MKRKLVITETRLSAGEKRRIAKNADGARVTFKTVTQIARGNINPNERVNTYTGKFTGKFPGSDIALNIRVA